MSKSIGGSAGDSKREGMLAVNDLHYVLPPDLSVSVNKTYKNHFFQQASYKNDQRSICILNSGADYGDMRSSSLEFDVKLPSGVSATGAYFGKHGSAVNLIDNITISSRSGDELCRIQDLNHLCYTISPLRYCKDWFSSVGQGAGFNDIIPPRRSDGFLSVHFSVPLYLLSDLFGYGRLMPPMLLSGLRIEIQWADPKIAFACFNAGSVTGDIAGVTNGIALPAVAGQTRRILFADESTEVIGLNNSTFSGTDNDFTNSYNAVGDIIQEYEIINPYVAMTSVQLTDGTQRALNELSAVNGLEIVYCDYERTQATISSTTDTTVQLEVRKACSRALNAFLRTRRESYLTETKVAPLVDSFQTAPWDYDQWQWQLGSLYFPQQPVRSNADGDVASIISESYKHTLEAVGTYKSDSRKKSAMGLFSNKDTLDISEDLNQDYTTAESGLPAGAGANNTFRPGAHFYDGEARYHLRSNHDGESGTFANGGSTICASMERSDLFNLTGVPINNSRVLSARVSYKRTGNRNINKAYSRNLTIFLKYVRLARVFLNNVEVEQ